LNDAAAEIKRRAQAQFGAAGDAYVRSAGHATGDDLERLRGIVAAEPVGRALDVATGGGHTALAIAPHARLVIASDLTEKMLRTAAPFVRGKGAANTGFAAADAEALPFADTVFDLVTCRIAPHHFADCARFVREIARVLAPNGRAVVIDSLSPDEPDLDRLLDNVERWRDPTHVRSYSRTEWLGFFRDAGLSVEETDVLTKTHDLDDWLARSRATPEDADRVRSALRTAPASARARFDISYNESGEPLSFADEKLLIAARRTA
jgi:SAM-dependent methyltransferase